MHVDWMFVNAFTIQGVVFLYLTYDVDSNTRVVGGQSRESAGRERTSICYWCVTEPTIHTRRARSTTYGDEVKGQLKKKHNINILY